MFPRFPWGLHRAAVSEHEDVAVRAGGVSSGCRGEGVLPVLHRVMSSPSLRPRPGAPLTFPKAPCPPQIFTVLEPKEETQFSL